MYSTKLKLNIDGLPITKNTSSQFWSILGVIVANFYIEFIISIYHGNMKSQDVDVFLKPFVDEVKSIFYTVWILSERLFILK